MRRPAVWGPDQHLYLSRQHKTAQKFPVWHESTSWAQFFSRTGNFFAFNRAPFRWARGWYAALRAAFHIQENVDFDRPFHVGTNAMAFAPFFNSPGAILLFLSSKLSPPSAGSSLVASLHVHRPLEVPFQGHSVEI